MTRFEQLTQITTLQDAIAFLKEATGPDGIEAAELCINCKDQRPGCFKPECKEKIYAVYLQQEI